MTPGQVEELIQSGFLLAEAGEHQQALNVYSQILSADPDNWMARYYAGQLLLMNGEFDKGWPLCECRPKVEISPSLPIWEGQPVTGGAVFVAGEQGIGDNINFARYIPMVAERAPKVIFGTLPGLARLMSTVPGVAEVLEPGARLPKLSHYVHLLSLPHIFKTRRETIPATVPYLTADPALVEKWRKRLSGIPGPRVGLVWAGNPDFHSDARRSPGFDPFRAVLDVPGISFISLQKGSGEKTAIAPDAAGKIIDLGPEIESFDDTAAIMMSLDLVISSCTSPAHLAGALGRPLWIVLSNFPDWRWFRHGDTSPWYPTARLFRQVRGESWTLVLGRVADALKERWR